MDARLDGQDRDVERSAACRKSVAALTNSHGSEMQDRGESPVLFFVSNLGVWTTGILLVTPAA